MFRKLNTSTEHNLEFLMLLKGNSFRNVTFLSKNPQKVIEELDFLPKSQRFAFSMSFNLTEMVFLVHECLNLTRFYFSVSYALCIQ